MTIVYRLLDKARPRLHRIDVDQPLIAAARRLACVDCDMVVVCGRNGQMEGVVTKTDVVARIGSCAGHSCSLPIADAMVRDVFSCCAEDEIAAIWNTMKARRLKNVPMLDASRIPIGVVNARDVLTELLLNVENEEALLRDYVMSVGYR